MTDGDLVGKVAARAGLEPAQVRAVLAALSELGCEHEQAGQPLPMAALGLARCHAFKPRASQATTAPAQACDAGVEQLIAQARQHPLGVEFLLEGEPGCVAAIFGTHAFAVDAARQRLTSSDA